MSGLSNSFTLHTTVGEKWSINGLLFKCCPTHCFVFCSMLFFSCGQLIHCTGAVWVLLFNAENLKGRTTASKYQGWFPVFRDSCLSLVGDIETAQY